MVWSYSSFLLYKDQILSGKVKSNVCKAAAFQLMKRGSITSLHLSILSPTTCAAPTQIILLTPSAPPTSAWNLNSLCSSQFSTEESTTDTRLIYRTECPKRLPLHVREHMCHYRLVDHTVTNSLNPKISASGSTHIIRANLVNRCIAPHFFTSYPSDTGFSSPVKFLFRCSRN